MMPNKSIYINNFKKEINLLYANTPIGVGARFFNFTLIRSKIGLGDQYFPGNRNIQFRNIFKFKFDPDPIIELAEFLTAYSKCQFLIGSS